MAAEFESGMFVKDVPWHGLGTIVYEAPNSREALKMAGLDWEVKKVPLFTSFKNKYLEVPNTFANERSLDGSVLGIVSDKYTIVQNAEAFEFVDCMLDIEKGKIKYETAGSLRKGKRIWLLVKLQEFQLVGDKAQNYLCFTNTFDGSGAVRAMVTPIRVVCMNTLNLAIKQAKRSWSCVHMGNIVNKLEEAKSSLKLVNNYIENLQSVGEHLQDRKLDFVGVLNEIVPNLKNDTRRILRNKEEIRLNILELTKNDDLKKFGSSAWTLINAVSDYNYHRKPKRSSQIFKEKAWDRAISGGNLVDIAYEIIEAA